MKNKSRQLKEVVENDSTYSEEQRQLYRVRLDDYGCSFVAKLFWKKKFFFWKNIFVFTKYTLFAEKIFLYGGKVL